jgi:hypothetical protein
MKLKLPDFSGTSCVLLGLCGTLADTRGTSDKNTILIARKKAGGTAGLVRLIMGGPAGHIHCDFAAKNYFEGQYPKTNASFKEICDALSKFEGRQVKTAALRAEYYIPQDDLPALLSASVINSTKDGISIRTTGGRLSVKGLPINEINWRLRKGGTAEIVLNTRVKGPVEDEMLTSSFEVVQQAASVILRGDENG